MKSQKIFFRLPQHHPALSERYDTLRIQAQTPASTDDPAVNALRHQRWQAVRDITSCLTEIRKLDGFRNFLLKPNLSRHRPSLGS